MLTAIFVAKLIDYEAHSIILICSPAGHGRICAGFM